MHLARLGGSLKYKYQLRSLERCVRPNTFHIPEDAMFHIAEIKTEILWTHVRIFYNFDTRAS
jgi:hypothetical protein